MAQGSIDYSNFKTIRKGNAGGLPLPERGFVSTTLAETWEQGLISGNGTVGAVVLGDPTDEKIVFSHERMWLPQGEPMPPVNTAARFSEMRDLVERGFYEEAMHKGFELSGRENHSYPDRFVPAFDLRIETTAEGEVRDYMRSVDFLTGVATIHWTDDRGIFERRLFVSRADGIAVLKFTGPGERSINCTLRLAAREPSSKLREGHLKGSNKNFASHVSGLQTKANGDFLSFTSGFTQSYPGGIQSMDGVARVVAIDAETQVQGDRIIIHGATQVLVLVKLEPGFEASGSQVKSFKQTLSQIDPDYDRLLEHHAEIHGGMFSRMRLDIGGGVDHQLTSEELIEISTDDNLSKALTEKVFDAGRYNIISSCGEMPPTLQGVWAGTYSSYWSGGYTNNGNVASAIAVLLRGNTPELMKSYTGYIESLLPYLRTNARMIFGARGIQLPVSTANHGYNMLPLGWGGGFWTAGAAWAAHFFYDYYLYTGDKEFLAEHALPFMEEAALFFKDFLYEDSDGMYVFNPSYSPENTPSNSNGGPVTLNATMDVMTVRELLTNLIEGSHVLNVNQDKITLWEKMRAKLPNYMLNAEGMVKEWSTPKLEDNLDHRHSSHLYGLFDGMPAELEHQPELREGFRRIVEYKLEHFYKEPGFMSFGIVQLAKAATSLGESELAYRGLVQLVNHYWLANLASMHNPKWVFNMDISGGLPAVLIKMLLDSRPGVVKLLPALPKEWPTGTLEGALCRGQIEVGKLQWEPERIFVSLRSGKEQTIALVAPAAIETITVVGGESCMEDSVHNWIRRVKLPKDQGITLNIKIAKE